MDDCRSMRKRGKESKEKRGVKEEEKVIDDLGPPPYWSGRAKNLTE